MLETENFPNILLKDTTQCLWISLNQQPLNLKWRTLPLSHCAPNQVHCGMDSLFRTFTASTQYVSTVNPALSGHSKRRPKNGFQDRLSLNAGQKYCRMLQESILQYFRPSLGYHLPLRPLFCLF